jgi:hypothetical protein
MKSFRFTTAIFAVMMITAVLAIAGCTSPQGTATPSPVPSPVPSPTPVPGNQIVEREYQYVERFYSGIDHYNSGIELMRAANNTSVSGDYTNASRQMLLAKDRMDAASEDFRAMKHYAGSSTETSLSDKWVEIADYESMSFQNASDAFSEYAFQMTRPKELQNLLRYNNYVEQANHYSALALEVRKQADALQSTMTFMAPTAQP